MSQSEKGDWVAFMSGGLIQHGEVLYTKTETLGRLRIYTTNQALLADDILEVRKKPLEEPR